MHTLNLCSSAELPPRLSAETQHHREKNAASVLCWKFQISFCRAPERPRNYLHAAVTSRETQEMNLYEIGWWTCASAAYSFSSGFEFNARSLIQREGEDGENRINHGTRDSNAVGPLF